MVNPNNKWVWYGAAAAGIAAVLTYLYFAVEPAEFLFNIYYVRSAINPFRGDAIPWGYRILTSALVYILPFSVETGFYFVNLTALAASAFVLVLICREMGVRYDLSMIAIVPYLLSSGVNWQIREIWFNDAISHLCIALAVLCMLKKQYSLCSLVSTIGVLNRSTSLFLLPVWYIFHYGWTVKRKSIFQTLLVWGPPVLLYFLLQKVFFPSTSFSYIRHLPESDINTDIFRYYYSELFTWNTSESVLLQRMFSWDMLNRFFGTLLPVSILGLWSNDPIYRRLFVWLAIVWLQFLVAVDVGRLETYAFPILIPLALHTIQAWTASLRYPHVLSVILLLLFSIFPENLWVGMVLTLALVMKQYWHPKSIDANVLPNPNIPKFHAAYAISAIVIIYILFGLFCFKTVSIRPTPLLSFPPSITNQEFTLLYFRSDGTVFHSVIEKPLEIPSNHTIKLGLPEIGMYHIAIPIIQNIHDPCVYNMYIYGSVKQGDALFFNTGSIENRKIAANKSEPLRIHAAGAEQFFIDFNHVVTSKDDYLLLYNLEDWQGEIQFIVSDASKLHAMNKSKKIY